MSVNLCSFCLEMIQHRFLADCEFDLLKYWREFRMSFDFHNFAETVRGTHGLLDSLEVLFRLAICHRADWWDQIVIVATEVGWARFLHCFLTLCFGLLRLLALVEDMLFVKLLSSHQVYHFIGLLIVLAFNLLYFLYSSIPVWNFYKLSCLKCIILLNQIIVDKLHFA